jgi:hypothetical protein
MTAIAEGIGSAALRIQRRVGKTELGKANFLIVAVQNRCNGPPPLVNLTADLKASAPALGRPRRGASVATIFD